MNLPIGTANNSNTFKNLKAQYIAAACGIALATVAVIDGVTSSSSSKPATHDFSTPGTIVSQNGPSHQVAYFLVDTDTRAKMLESTLAADSFNYVNPIETHVIVADTEQEARFQRTLEEMMLVGTTVQVADLRAEPKAPSVEPRAVMENSELDAAIAAGVLSSERAAWAFDDAPRAASKTSAYTDETVEEYAVREAAQISLSAK